MRGSSRTLVLAALGAFFVALDAGAATLPMGSILINGGAASTNVVEVTLNLSATDTAGTGSLFMRFRNTDTEPYSAWAPFQETANWTLGSAPGTKKVFVQFMDGAGSISDANPAAGGAQPYSDTIVLNDKILPTGTILVDDGAVSTNSMLVTLTLTASDNSAGPLSMRFRNSLTEPYSAWEPFLGTREWTLVGAVGTKKVFVQYMDGAGNISDADPAAAGSQAYMDSIVLYDKTPPTGSILIDNGAASTATTAVTLSLSATDTGGSGLASMRLRNSDAEPYGAWVPYQPAVAWTLAPEPGTRKVSVQFMDGSGNISDANPGAAGSQGYSDTILLADAVPPTGSIVINGGAASTDTPEVTLTLTAADSGGGAVVSMRLRNEASGSYGAWEPFQGTRAWTLSFEAGTREVFVQFMDGAGNISDADPLAADLQGYGDMILFAPASTPTCEDCHGATPYPGIGGGSGDDAPNVMAYYAVNGHGTKSFDPDGAGPLPARAVACTDCHDVTRPSPGTHLTGRFETYEFPGSPFGGPNSNTSHLVPAFFGNVSAEKDWQLNFDNHCYRNANCHRNPPTAGHRHEVTHRDGVVLFGAHSTVVNPKQVRPQPYWTPWTIGDISTDAPPPSRHYAPCVSCHDPHGVDSSGYRDCRAAPDRNYHMTRKDFCDLSYFCNSNCHQP